MSEQHVSVITSPIVGLFIQRLGTKLTVCIGLAVAGTFTMIFGLSKDYFGIASPNQQYFFIIFAFIYGMGSTLAETGVLVAVEKLCTANNLARSQYNSARSDTNISVSLHVYRIFLQLLPKLCQPK